MKIVRSTGELAPDVQVQCTIELDEETHDMAHHHLFWLTERTLDPSLADDAWAWQDDDAYTRTGAGLALLRNDQLESWRRDRFGCQFDTVRVVHLGQRAVTRSTTVVGCDLEPIYRRATRLPRGADFDDLEAWAERQPAHDGARFALALDGLDDEVVTWFDRHLRHDPITRRVLVVLEDLASSADFDDDALLACQAGLFHRADSLDPIVEHLDEDMLVPVVRGWRSATDLRRHIDPNEESCIAAAALLRAAVCLAEGKNPPAWANRRLELYLPRLADLTPDMLAHLDDA